MNAQRATEDRESSPLAETATDQRVLHFDNLLGTTARRQDQHAIKSR